MNVVVGKALPFNSNKRYLLTRSLHPPDSYYMLDFSQNYFELFGLPADFRVDLDEVSLRYRDLQKVVHPDKFASASEQQQRVAMQSATLVNEAYEVLKDPLKRAQYLLSLKGRDADGENLTTTDGSFLMQQMELREALDESREADDPLEALDTLLDTIKTAINEQIAKLTILLETSSEEDLDAAMESVYKMQFLKKLYSEAESLEAELEDMI